MDTQWRGRRAGCLSPTGRALAATQPVHSAGSCCEEVPPNYLIARLGVHGTTFAVEWCGFEMEGGRRILADCESVEMTLSE